jgi:exodeoxyribonuclease V alpha subunit
VVAWLGSVLPDVGGARARALVDRFGAELWDVILWKHERLTEVDGITPARADAIREAYLDVEAERVHMVALRGWGLTDSQVARCVAAWGSLPAAVQHIRANPYDLARHVHGFGFERSDMVALKAGVPHDSPARVQAGVRHLLEEASAAGHMYMSGGALQRMAAEMLGVPAALIPAAIKDLARSHDVTRRGWRIYLQRLEDAEATCAAVLARLIGKAAV